MKTVNPNEDEVAQAVAAVEHSRYMQKTVVPALCRRIGSCSANETARRTVTWMRQAYGWTPRDVLGQPERAARVAFWDWEAEWSAANRPETPETADDNPGLRGGTVRKVAREVARQHPTLVLSPIASYTRPYFSFSFESTQPHNMRAVTVWSDWPGEWGAQLAEQEWRDEEVWEASPKNEHELRRFVAHVVKEAKPWIEGTAAANPRRPVTKTEGVAAAVMASIGVGLLVASR